MKKTYKIIATLLMAVLALQGCVKEYTKALPGEEQPTPEQPVVEDDDVDGQWIVCVVGEFLFVREIVEQSVDRFPAHFRHFA